MVCRPPEGEANTALADAPGHWPMMAWHMARNLYLYIGTQGENSTEKGTIPLDFSEQLITCRF